MRRGRDLLVHPISPVEDRTAAFVTGRDLTLGEIDPTSRELRLEVAQRLPQSESLQGARENGERGATMLRALLQVLNDPYRGLMFAVPRVESAQSDAELVDVLFVTRADGRFEDSRAVSGSAGGVVGLHRLEGPARSFERPGRLVVSADGIEDAGRMAGIAASHEIVGDAARHLRVDGAHERRGRLPAEAIVTGEDGESDALPVLTCRERGTRRSAEIAGTLVQGDGSRRLASRDERVRCASQLPASDERLDLLLDVGHSRGRACAAG